MSHQTQGVPIHKRVIGRNEYISLPQLGLYNINAKIDTGAYSCALHCDNIALNEDDTVAFDLCDSTGGIRRLTCNVASVRDVRSSNGIRQERVFIETPLHVGNMAFVAEVSLTNRASMTYMMLVGSAFLSGRFVVDVALRHVMGRMEVGA
ncbi:MAG: ATP-dependent zinc protease [Campylobacterales bacterium]|nr:ATP-dependent zinc protease [Campylobacterales bacterium]